jgi:allantoin racemase
VSEILLINPNTNPRTTAMLAGIAAERLRGDDRVTVRAATVATGPAVIVDDAGLRAAGSAVLECALQQVRPSTVALVVGAIGDPGVEALQAAFTIPVIGIGAASARSAARGGRRFGIVTTTPLLAGSLQRLAERHGAAGTFTGVRLTDSSALALATDPARQLRELERACLLCRETDGAEAVVIGGGPLGDSARALAASIGMVVVQPVPAAIDEALALIHAGAHRDVL